MIQFFYKSKFAANTNIFPKIRIAQVKELPIKKLSKEAQQPFIEKADKMLALNRQLQEKKNKFLNRLRDNLFASKDSAILSKKLEAFYNYDFKTFVLELKKKKVALSLQEQDEWEEYFNTYKREINQLQDDINTTDKEIDQMVRSEEHTSELQSH